MTMEEVRMDSGFLKRLFDLSFSEFITVKIIRLIYVLAMVGAGFWALIILLGGFATKSMTGILGGFLLAPVAFLVSVTMARIWLETLIVLFRIAENTGRMADNSATPAPK